MLCSLGELNLTTHDFPYAIADGIFLIDEDCKTGEDIHTAIGLNDTSVEFEITSNRPDCFVITSYSIHYTKLYEIYFTLNLCGFSACPLRDNLTAYHIHSDIGLMKIDLV